MEHQPYTERQLDALDLLKKHYPQGCAMIDAEDRAVFDSLIARGNGMVELVEPVLTQCPGFTPLGCRNWVDSGALCSPCIRRAERLALQKADLRQSTAEAPGRPRVALGARVRAGAGGEGLSGTGPLAPPTSVGQGQS